MPPSSPVYFGLVLILEPVVLYIELMDGWSAGISSEFIWALWKYMQIYFICMYMKCVCILYMHLYMCPFFLLREVHNFFFILKGAHELKNTWTHCITNFIPKWTLIERRNFLPPLPFQLSQLCSKDLDWWGRKWGRRLEGQQLRKGWKSTSICDFLSFFPSFPRSHLLTFLILCLITRS